MLRSGRSFASDNNATCHPTVLEALSRANRGHVVGYGEDPFTATAAGKFREHFGEDALPFFVFTGTAANVLSLQAATKPHHAVICASSAHIETSECGAAERFTGCKLIDLPTPDGKLTPKLIQAALKGFGNVHAVQPRVISITQVTERGTLYSAPEVRAIAELAHARGLLLHMDGARLANAAAAQDLTLAQASRQLGVDVLSFGGTKNGLICGESVVLFGNLAREAVDFGFMRMQAMQLASKMRYISVQFEALLTDELWLRNARHANAMAKRFAEGLPPGAKLSLPVEANILFVRLPIEVARKLQNESFFYTQDLDQAEVEARWICSFDTSSEDIDEFLGLLRNLLP